MHYFKRKWARIFASLPMLMASQSRHTLQLEQSAGKELQQSASLSGTRSILAHKSLTQTGGAIVFDQQKLAECLPGLFSLDSVTSCSDQGAVLVHISEPVAVDFVLTTTVCPANFEVLVSEGPTVDETMEACPIETAAAEKSSCYSTTAFGMALSVNFTRDTEGANAGVVNFGIAQGESGKSCKQVPFTQDGQALSVDETSISKCLPDSVKLDDAKLCQGHVLISLDGFGPQPLKLELDKIQCDSARRLSQEVGTFLV